MHATLRQWCFPPEFRIAELPWTAELQEQVDRVVQLLQHPPTAPTAVPAGTSAPAEPATADLRFMAEVATGLWRARAKLPADDGDLPREMRALLRAVEAAWDGLVQGGIEVSDPKGDFVTGGEPYNVLTYEETPGLSREMVIETVKPLVYYQGKLVQWADVIVGTPVETQPSEA